MATYGQILNPFSAHHGNRRAQNKFDAASEAYAADPTAANKEALASAYNKSNESIAALGAENADISAQPTAADAGKSALAGTAVNVASDIASGKDATRSAVTGVGQAAGAALGAPLGPIGSAVGSSLGGAAAGAVLGPEEQIIQSEIPQVQQAEFVPIGGEAPQGGANPFYNNGTVGAMQIPGPMSHNPASPDTFINGQIASVHYPKLNYGAMNVSSTMAPTSAYMGGTVHVPGHQSSIKNVAGYMGGTPHVQGMSGHTPYAAGSYMDGTPHVPGYFGGSFNVSPLNDGTAGAAYGADTIGNLNQGTHHMMPGGEMMANADHPGMMEGPMGTPEFGYVPSGPTRQEIHADMKAAGAENREMMKFQADEKRKTEMHHLKMADMAESAAIKQANMKKGPMAR